MSPSTSAPAVEGVAPTRPSVISHVTVPCTDLALAEEFYVGLLGLRVVSRVDAARRAAMGWSATDIDARSVDHVGVVASDGGLRLDLFTYPQGVPPAAAPKHPHIGLEVRAAEFAGWEDRLRTHGVVVDGPRRLGPPGQASLYFDDPSGNHLEIHTDGVDTEGLPFGGPRGSLAYRWDGLDGPGGHRPADGDGAPAATPADVRPEHAPGRTPRRVPDPEAPGS